MKDDNSSIFHVRRVCGLTALVAKRRKCLVCEELFDSEGSHNRICAECKAMQKHTATATLNASRMLLGLGKSDDSCYKEV
jgi:hypothetical protein